MARDAIRAAIATHRKGGGKLTPADIAAVTEAEVKVLRGSLKANRVVVVPIHVDTKRLWKQLGGIMCWQGKGTAKAVKVGLP